MTLKEISSETTLEEVKRLTGARFNVCPNLKNF